MDLPSFARSGIVGVLVLLGLVYAANEGQAPSPDEPSAYDLHIEGGTVVDGTGSAGRRADVLVRDDTIAFVGPVDTDTIDATQTFDATGLHVTPGFVDPHAHGNPLESPRFRNFLAMGVTTIFLGQDGSSAQAQTLDNHLAAIANAGPYVNVGTFIGHNTLRHESGVGYGMPTAAQRDTLARLVAHALQSGAFGLSTGLEYEPGGQARMPELVALAEPVATHDGVVMSHLRSEDANDIEDSVAELLEQGRRSGADVHVSHLKIVQANDTNRAHAVLDQMAAARDDGIEVTADVYPYTASFTGISILFPEWARPPNDYEAVRTRREDALRRHLRTRVQQRNGPEATLFGTGTWRGQTLAEVAEDTKQSPADVLMALGPNGPSAAYFVMDEDVMTTFLTADSTVVSSDGSPTMHHPRGYGAFARVLSHYVGPEKPLSLERAVHKMTGRTASILGLDDPKRVNPPRGVVREGYAADLLAFDPGEVEDQATYTRPHRRARGMERVWINGTLTWAADSVTATRGSGAVLRAGQLQE